VDDMSDRTTGRIAKKEDRVQPEHLLLVLYRGKRTQATEP
jgi:hypothetical protein